MTRIFFGFNMMQTFNSLLGIDALSTNQLYAQQLQHLAPKFAENNNQTGDDSCDLLRTCL
jgi:hypothetical protein